MGDSRSSTRRPGASTASLPNPESVHDDSYATVAVGTGEDGVDGISGETPLAKKIGRHVVLDEIGRGGMGEVYRAYDPKLQREVALKRLRPKSLGKDGTARFEQEARAMAKLSHPNVVSVYDVEGLDDGQLVLVMEFVDGPTLRSWLRQTSRPWQDVLAPFLDAGRGLAAAHRAGLLHRDFKPANVLVTHELAKVTDFGLAKRAKDTSGSVSLTSSGEFLADVDEDDLTRDGEVMGTPRYMAPEQHRGHDLTHAVDQFAFCVALWEALTQAAPYSGEGLAKQKHKGPPAWPTQCGPRWLGDALRRGLAPRPEARWPSMVELLEALGHDPEGRRKRWTRIAGVAGLTLTVGVGAYFAKSGDPDPCSGAELQLERQWSPAARASVQGGLTAVDVVYAESVWERADARLAAYADDWVASYRSACEASVRKEQSASMMDLRVGCLDRGRQSLGAIVDVLSKADVDILRNTDSMLDTLPNLERCSDIAALQEGTDPPTPGELEAVTKARDALAAAKIARVAGHFDEADAQLGRAQLLVDALEYGPIHAEYHLERGQILRERGQWQNADEALRRAMRLAIEGHDWENTARAAADILQTVGGRLGRPDEVLALRDVAESAAKGNPLLEAQVHAAVASALSESGNLEAAERESRAALQKRVEELGPEHLQVASSRNNLGAVLRQLGRYKEAEVEYRAVIDMLSRSIGSDHPNIAITRGNLASLLRIRGRLDDAEAQIRLAQDARKRSLGERHVMYGAGKLTLANILADARRFEEASVEAREGRTVVEAAVGREHQKTAQAANTVGRIMILSGHPEEAEEAFREYLEILRSMHGDDHPKLGGAYMNLAVSMRRQGNLEEAEQIYREAERVWTTAYGPDHASLEGLHNNLGNLYVDMKRHEEAKRSYERSLEIGSVVLDPDDPSLLETRGNLANALVELGDIDRAESERRYVVKRLVEERAADDPKTAIARSRLAALLLRRDEPEEALTLATAAHTQARADGLSAKERGDIAMTLAESMEAAAGRPVRKEARARADEALQSFVQAGSSGREGAERARAWLRMHPL